MLQKLENIQNTPEKNGKTTEKIKNDQSVSKAAKKRKHREYNFNFILKRFL